MSNELNKPATEATPGQWVPKKQLDEAICERDALRAEIERLHQRIEHISKSHVIALQLAQPHEPVGRTEYVVGLERTVEKLLGALRTIADSANIVMVDADTLDNYYRGIARAVLGEETS